MTFRALLLAGIAAVATAGIDTSPAAAQNRSDVVQNGQVNTANVSQRGNRGNNAQTVQTGGDNLAIHRQRGRSNTSGIGQDGGGINDARVDQRRR